MSEPNALVNFRLDRDRPMRIKWLATDGVPGDGYKAQVTTIRFDDGATLEMDSSAILEQAAPDPAGGIGAYLVTFNGMVGFAGDHPAPRTGGASTMRRTRGSATRWCPPASAGAPRPWGAGTTRPGGAGGGGPKSCPAAMRDDAPSRTAQWVAAARGMGRLLPEGVRL